MRYALTPIQRRVFDFLEAQISETGMPPTHGDISRMLGRDDGRRASEVLHALKKRGWVDFIPRSKRSLIILPERDEPYPSQFNYNNATVTKIT